MNYKINKKQIVGRTQKAILVKLPNSTMKGKFKYWLPLYLTKKAEHEHELKISLPADFLIRIFRNRGGRSGTYDATEEYTFTTEEFEEFYKQMKNR